MIGIKDDQSGILPRPRNTSPTAQDPRTKGTVLSGKSTLCSVCSDIAGPVSGPRFRRMNSSLPFLESSKLASSPSTFVLFLCKPSSKSAGVLQLHLFAHDIMPLKLGCYILVSMAMTALSAWLPWHSWHRYGRRSS